MIVIDVLLAFDRARVLSPCNADILLFLENMAKLTKKYIIKYFDLPLMLRGALQPRQISVLTVNFISPPTVGVIIEIARVCSPAKTI
jgi:hypothetical protein